MRRFAGFLLGAALGLCTASAGAQQAVAPTPTRVGKMGGAPPNLPAQPAPAAPVTTGEPPFALMEPVYQPSEHAGLTEAAWLRATRGTARRSTGMMVTGLALVGVGALLMTTGTVVYANGNNQPCNAAAQSPVVLPCSSPTNHVTGMALLASGVIGVGLGLPLTFYGAADVPRAEAAGRITAPRFLHASLALGLRGATLALHF